MNKKIFVAGATGFQGRSIGAVLLEEGYCLTTLLPKKEEKRPPVEGLKIYEGAWTNQAALLPALKGVEAAVFTFPLLFDMEVAINYAKNFILACQQNEVPLVIFNTGFDLPNQKTGLLSLDLKLVIQEYFAASSLNVITIMPDVYLDNLVAPWALPLIVEQGILPYPIANQIPSAWISHHDLGNAVLGAIQRPDLAGKILPIGGNIWTGEEIAQAIGEQIGKKIQYIGLAPNDFEQQLLPAFGATAAREISNLYRYLAEKQTHIVTKDFVQTQALLNYTPQTLTGWIQSINWHQ